MLQKRGSSPQLCGAHELSSVHENLAAFGLCEARDGAGGRPDGRTACQDGVDSHRLEGFHEPSVDLTVRHSQRAEGADRGGYRVRYLVLMPHRLTAGRPAHQWNVDVRNGLVPSN